MRKHEMPNLIRTAILILALSITGIAQTSANSTQGNQSPDATAKVPVQLAELKNDTAALRLATAEARISHLINEVKKGRTFTAANLTKIDDLEARLKAELQNSISLEKSYASAVREIESLRIALMYADLALKAKDQTITLLTEQRDDARTRAKNANKRATVATITALILGALKFL